MNRASLHPGHPLLKRGAAPIYHGISPMLQAYREHVAERETLGIPPLPLNAEQVAELTQLLLDPPAGEEEVLMDLLWNRIPPGVDQAAYVKAAFLSGIAKGETACPLIDANLAVDILGTMLGGYNVGTLVDLLDDANLAESAARELKGTLLIFDSFNDVEIGRAHV